MGKNQIRYEKGGRNMSIIPLLIICSVSLALLFLSIFIWWVKSGQADDLETPAHRILFEDKQQTHINTEPKNSNRYE
jgi:cbb3-type cytochrome oxidase maturation protein